MMWPSLLEEQHFTKMRFGECQISEKKRKRIRAGLSCSFKNNLKTVNSDSVWMKSQFNWTGYSKDDGSPLKNGMCSHLKSAARMGSHREVIFFENNFRTWEFDPGSGWTLAACLTHASRTKHFIWFSSEMKILWLSGGRVSNAWVTCLIQGDNSWKRLLIPHKRTAPHGAVWKTPVVWDGPASD